MTRLLARFLTTAALLSVATPAVAAPPGPLQGTWVGTQEGLRSGAVTFIVDGDRIVVSDGGDTMVGKAAWKAHGPGTKDGRLTMHVDVTVSGLFDASGRTRRPTARGRRVGSVAIGDDELRLCWAESGDAKLRPAWSESRGRGSKTARCFNLKRVGLGDGGTRVAPPAMTGPPDGSAPNPPPARLGRACVAACEADLAKSAMSAQKVAQVCNDRCDSTPATSTRAVTRCMSACRDRNRGSALSAKQIEERCQTGCYMQPTEPAAPSTPEDFECMRECRQHNQMRAVSAEQIDADCRRTCSVK